MFRRAFFLSILWGFVIGGTLLFGLEALAQSEPSQPKTDSGLSVATTDAPWIVRIQIENQSMVNRLANEIDVWSVHHEEGYLVAMVNEAERLNLDLAGIPYERDIERMADMAALRGKATAASVEGDEPGGIPGFPCYRTVEETYASMESLAANYPTLAEFKDIGDSWDKVTEDGPEGYEIHALVLTNQERQIPKPRFFLVATVHAREFTPTELAMRYAERLVDSYGVDPNITWLLDYAEVHVVPLGNPDGRKEAEALILWRKNRNVVDGACMTVAPSAFSHGGVDLNRNSSFKWNGCGPGQNCSSSNVCAQTFRGTGAASEPEVQALEAYMSSIFSDTRGTGDNDMAALDTAGLMITLHSYSELIIFPWGWTTQPAPNDAQLTTLARKFGYFTDYRVCRAGEPGCLYLTDGTNDDWAYGELGLPAYTFELGTDFFQSCSVFENEILEKNMDALLYAAKSARLPYQLPAGPEITALDLSASMIITTTALTVTATADDGRYATNSFGAAEPTQVISAARYSIDEPSWITGTQTYSMTAVDGALTNSVESLVTVVDTAGWISGDYTIYVEAQDEDGNWGVPSAALFTIARNEFEAVLGIDPTPNRTEGADTRLGDTIDYVITLDNVGWADDIYTLTITSTWAIEPPQPTIVVSAGQSVDIALSIQVPPTITQRLSVTTQITDTLIFTTESQGSGQVIDRQQITLAASPYRRYFPFFFATQDN